MIWPRGWPVRRMRCFSAIEGTARRVAVRSPMATGTETEALTSWIGRGAVGREVGTGTKAETGSGESEAVPSRRARRAVRKRLETRVERRETAWRGGGRG